MKKHLLYEYPARSVIKDYAFGTLAWESRAFPNRRRALRNLGHTVGAVLASEPRPLTLDAATRIAAAVSPKMPLWTLQHLLRSLGLAQVGDAIQRDADRYESEHWVEPWTKCDWFKAAPFRLLHSVHASTTSPGSIAFAETPAKLVADRFTIVKPGRYLTKYFSHVLSEKEIKMFADEFVAKHSPVEVKFARDDDPDEMIRVIAEGPSESCMSNGNYGNDNWFVGHVHPAAIYATPDIEIAYFEQNGEVLARAVCNRNTKKVARCYGDARRLLPALGALGYEQEERALSGCRIRKICNQNGDGYIMAYVDAGIGSGGGALGYDSHDSNYFMLSSRGEESTYVGYEHKGVTVDEDALVCDDCGEYTSEDDSYYIEHSSCTVCMDCFDRNYVRAIGQRYEENVHQDDAVYCESDDTYYITEYASDHDVYECQQNGRYYKLDDLVHTSRGLVHTNYVVKLDVDDGDGNHYAHRNDVVMTHDGRVIHEDDAVLHTVYFHKDDDIENDQTPNDATNTNAA